MATEKHNEIAVSVVIPVRNESRSIARCLDSIQAQRFGRPFEIIVVDGMSTDGTRAILADRQREDGRIRVLDNPARITPSALNIGIRSARGSVIARMDGHAIAPVDYLQRGCEVLETSQAWCVGGQMRRVGTDATTKAIAAATMSPLGVGDAAHNYATAPRWVETVFLGIWPRWVFERVGLFDEELVRNQDDELSYRIREAGGRIRFEPSIDVAYEPRRTFGALYSQYRQYAMWKVRVWQMHPRALRWRHWVPMAWIGAIGAGLVTAVVWPPALIMSGAAIGSYLLVMTAASHRYVDPSAPRTLVLRSLVTLHLAYGIGFWQGLIRFAPRWWRGRRGRPGKLDPVIP